VAGQEEIGETQILAALLGIAEMVSGLTDTDELLGSIVRVTPHLVQSDRCVIMMYEASSREFRTLASFGPGRSTPFEGLRIQESEIPRLAHRLVTLRLPALVKASSREVSRGRLLGALWLDDTRAPHYFTSKEINLAQGVASQIAIGLDAARLGLQLDLERRRIEALSAALADGLLVVDRDLRIVYLDGGAEALLGWQSSEVRGRRMYEVFEISEAEASIAWTREKSGPTPVAKTFSLRAHDGLRLDCGAQAIAVRGDEGEVIQVLYALRKKPGSKGYAERMMDSIDQLAPLHEVARPE